MKFLKWGIGIVISLLTITIIANSINNLTNNYKITYKNKIVSGYLLFTTDNKVYLYRDVNTDDVLEDPILTPLVLDSPIKHNIANDIYKLNDGSDVYISNNGTTITLLVLDSPIKHNIANHIYKLNDGSDVYISNNGTITPLVLDSPIKYNIANEIYKLNDGSDVYISNDGTTITPLALSSPLSHSIDVGYNNLFVDSRGQLVAINNEATYIYYFDNLVPQDPYIKGVSALLLSLVPLIMVAGTILYYYKKSTL